MKHLLIFIAIILLTSCIKTTKEKVEDYTQYVNPFIGTDGTGHTFPGACLPFGFVQASPDNTDKGWDYPSGYHYKDSVILGFSQTHLSGTGISDLGDVLLQPFIGEKVENFGTTYFKETEKASPGYYSVTFKNKIKVELTATEHVAFHRYTFPANTKARILVDLQHGLRFLTDTLVVDSDVKIVGNNSISGYCHTKNWVDRKHFFVVIFDKPFNNYKELPKKGNEKAPRYILDFELNEANILQAKIALSTVSVEGAELNLKTELPDWNFNEVRVTGEKIWNGFLSRIEIEAGQKQKEIFYTAMYQLFIQPVILLMWMEGIVVQMIKYELQKTEQLFHAFSLGYIPGSTSPVHYNCSRKSKWFYQHMTTTSKLLDFYQYGHSGDRIIIV